MGVSTQVESIVTRSTSENGYHRLGRGPGERRELLSPGSGSRPDELSVLLCAAHLSDLHICDAQSPGRAEFFDRWGDDDVPDGLRTRVGTYRPQETLTAQVADSMVRAINAHADAAPFTGAPLDLALVTGDAVDNGQLNEIRWYLDLLEGGAVRPDSGDLSCYEGVGSADGDERYWHPEPDAPRDRPKRVYDFPSFPGLHTLARDGFVAEGLRMPWLTVYGNHDALMQGTMPLGEGVELLPTRESKAIGFPDTWSSAQIVRFCRAFDGGSPASVAEWHRLPARTVTADPDRMILDRRRLMGQHFSERSRPLGHGWSAANLESGRAYYRHDLPERGLTILALDTVNEHGGWEGSIDAEQAAWLAAELTSADDEGRYAVVVSHHPLDSLTNPRSRDGAARRLGTAEVLALTEGHRSLVLWLDGHTHRPRVRRWQGWVEITAPSLIDFPQQARIVELAQDPSGELWLASTMIDHRGDPEWRDDDGGVDSLAGLSRELAANDWQWRVGDLARHGRHGAPEDRNVLVRLPNPFR